MQLTLNRWFTIKDATIGTLTIDGAFECFTLEDLVRTKKIHGKTAIPAGSYPVTLSESPRFSDNYEDRGLSRLVPLLEGVPGFDGVRIHIGNTAKDTEGCLLVGNWKFGIGAAITNSTTAYTALMIKLLADKTGIRITITDAPAVEAQPDTIRGDAIAGLFGQGATAPA